MLDLVITSRPRDLGGFSVKRVLPYASHRMVGPFIFFDHMGPAEFPVGEGMNVRPHPHIHLATVTYLFEGRIWHRDSLGSSQLIEPGAINWMIAGRGIVHSERTPEHQNAPMRMNGIQTWVALPESHENMDPSFFHHPSETLPQLKVNGCQVKVLLGEAFGKTSPVRVLSSIFYLEVEVPQGGRFELPVYGAESAVYVVDGEVEAFGTQIQSGSMAVVKTGFDPSVLALQKSKVMVLGGKPLGQRLIFWNFISSSQENIETAKRDWEKGPGDEKSRFPKVPGDETEFIPLPPET